MAEAAGPGRETLPRRVHVDAIRQAVAELLMEANYCIGDDVLDALRQAAEEEQSPLGRDILTQLVANYELARRGAGAGLPGHGSDHRVSTRSARMCTVVGGDLREAVNAGIGKAPRPDSLRNSVVGDPLLRRNTGGQRARRAARGHHPRATGCT